jgi:hypothetical protein
VPHALRDPRAALLGLLTIGRLYSRSVPLSKRAWLLVQACRVRMRGWLTVVTTQVNLVVVIAGLFVGCLYGLGTSAHAEFLLSTPYQVPAPARLLVAPLDAAHRSILYWGGKGALCASFSTSAPASPTSFSISPTARSRANWS